MTTSSISGDGHGFRPLSELPGTPENLAALLQLLDGWKCCGAPSLCGATCQDDELSDALARAHALLKRSEGVQR